MSQTMLAKRGPGMDQFDSAHTESDKITPIPMLQRRFAPTGGLGFNQTLTARLSSIDLNLSKSVLAKISNSTEAMQTGVSWRVSIGASAYRSNVDYIGNPNVNTTKHKWGVFGHASNAASELARVYQGERNAAVGAVPTHLNASELSNACHSLADTVSFIEGAECNCTSTWHRIWYNYIQTVLAALTGTRIQVATWANRPVNPTTLAHAISGVNHYSARAPEIMCGSHVTVELSQSETDLIPYINYLLGAGPTTFDWRWGDRNGNDRIPHLVAKTPVAISYSYLIRDNLNGAGPNPIDQALPGLGAGAAGAVGGPVEAWDRNLMIRALSVLARSMPIAPDVEAGAIKACIDTFAEPFNGVAAVHNAGADGAHTGYNAFLDQGVRRLPCGNHICCMATRITNDSPSTVSAQSRVRACVDVMHSIAGIRAVAEMCILAMQLAARQCGGTASISFPGIGFAAKHNQLVPVYNVSSSTEGNLLDLLTSSNSGDVSQLMLTTSLMMEVMFDCVYPESGLYFQYGNTLPDAGYPWPGATNIGECLASVHAAQIVDNTLRGAAVGLAGIPNRLGELAAQMPIDYTGVGGATVDGTSSSRIEDGVADPLPGVNMLGHAILFTRDDELQAGDVFEVEVAGFAPAGGVTPAVMRAQSVPLTLVNRQAFSRNGTFNDGIVHTGIMALYADFDAQRYADLRLTLPNTHHTNGYAVHADARARVPGFVAGAIEGSFAEMTGNVGVVLRRRPAKRNRVNEDVTSATGRKKGKEGQVGDDEGNTTGDGKQQSATETD